MSVGAPSRKAGIPPQGGTAAAASTGPAATEATPGSTPAPATGAASTYDGATSANGTPVAPRAGRDGLAPSRALGQLGVRFGVGLAPNPAAQELQQAQAALDARVARGGFEAQPLGEKKGGVERVGDMFIQRYTGGSNSDGGGMIVAPKDGSPAFFITNGFAYTCHQPQEVLGGRPLLHALGRPLEDEQPVPAGEATQRFEHGTLRWSPQRGVWMEPADVAVRRKDALPPPPPRQDLGAAQACGGLLDGLVDAARALGVPANTPLTSEHLQRLAVDPGCPLNVRSAAASLLAQPQVLAQVAPITRDSLRRAVVDGFLAPLTFSGEGHSHYFLEWASKQVRQNPAIRAVHDALGALLLSGKTPATVGAFLETVRGLARTHVEADPAVPRELKAQLANVAALVSVSAYALRNDGKEYIRAFPVFMWDGRSQDAGYDKAWHFSNHAMMALVGMVDGSLGSGRTLEEFKKAVADADKEGTAQRIATAYDARRGALGGLVAQTLPGPADETPTYAARPARLSGLAQTVYDTTVRIGDAHEYKASGGDSFDVHLDDIGDDRTAYDPTAPLYVRHKRVWGLQDAGVTRDLTANRLGAAFGLALFEAPQQQGSIPYDAGKVATTAAFAKDRGIPFDHYLADQLTVVRMMAGHSGQPRALRQTLLEEVRALGRDAGVARLKSELGAVVDALLGAGRLEDLSRFYGNLAVRHLQYGERLKTYEKDRDAEDSTGHTNWAMDQLRAGQGALLKSELLRRVDESAASF